MLLAVAVTLPGAALVGAADDEPKRVVGYRTEVPMKGPPKVDAQKKYSDQWYHVGDILTTICDERHVGRKEARAFLRSWLAIEDNDQAAAGGNSRIWWSAEELAARGKEFGHNRIAAVLEALRTRGLCQIMIHTTIVAGPPESIDAVFTDWTVLPANVSTVEAPADSFRRIERPFPKKQAPPHASASYLGQKDFPVIERPVPRKKATQYAHAQSIVQKDLPVRFAILDEKCAAEVLARLRKDRSLKVLAEPTLVTTNGRPAREQGACPLKVLAPCVLSRVEKPYCLVGIMVTACDVRSLERVAVQTRVGQVLERRFALVLLGNDVVDLERKRRPTLRNLAILAAMPSPCSYLLP